MLGRLKIQKLQFKAGSTASAEPLEIDCPSVTILVGPNNSGKSQTLREIEEWCRGRNPQFKVMEHISILWPADLNEFEAMLHLCEADPPENQAAQVDHFWVCRPTIRSDEKAIHQQIHSPSVKEFFRNRHEQPLREILTRLFTMRLDGRTRFDLVEPKETGPLESHPKNHLWALFKNDDGREKVRAFTKEAFSRHFVIDPTGMTKFRVRLSDEKPPNKAVEQGLDSDSRDFHKAAPLVSEFGDGVRTSVGLVSAVMSLTHRILLIDEPEAFLHPTLARRVGSVLATTARERQASLVVATHSPEFLIGCIQSVPHLRLVRLTYAKGEATARSIEPNEITALMRNPLLRSANALRALFHRGVIITEADADRAFYEEVNTRLLQSGRGNEDTLFLNAQNWQTIPSLVEPLRKLGIPAAAIFDFDVIGQVDFRHIWSLLHTTDEELQELQNLRANSKAILENVDPLLCKKNGLEALTDENKTSVGEFIQNMKNFGIFFVPKGELESWLSELGVQRSRKKSEWLVNMFSRLGTDPEDSEYISAENGDVWTFIEEIDRWIDNPRRKGIPE